MRKSFSRISFFVLTALLIGGFPNFMAQEAYAVTNVSGAIANDPDNDAEGANIGDKIVINFDNTTNSTASASMTSAEVIANFTSAQSSLFTDGTYTGFWNTTSQLTITITGVGFADAPIIGDTIAYDQTNGNIAEIGGTPEVTNTPIALSGDFGLVPDVISAVWSDPDNGDSVFGAGDILTLTFDNATDQTDYANRAAVDAVMTITGLSAIGAATYSAAWTSTTVLVVTITDPDIATPTVGSNVDGANTGVISSEAGSIGNWDNTLATTGNFGDSSGAPTPTSSGGGSGCDDCEAPTLGVDKRGVRLVSNGFTYNGHSVDAERFFTPYPLITANVGKTNIAEFKLYENQGVSNIRHFTLAFGMDIGDIISDSKAKIELDIDHEGTETVTVTDPENALDNIKVTTSTVSCMDDSFTECLGISIQHRFRAPLDFNIVGTDVWDLKRNAWQNTFNHGIEVVGKSLNPAKEYDGINKGHIYHLTETSKTTAVDEFGNLWSFNYGLWNMDYIDNKNTPVTLFLKEIIPTDGGFAGSDQFGTMYYLTQSSETTAVDLFNNTWSLKSGLWTMDSIYSKIILDSTPMGGYTRADSEFNVYKYGQSLLAENKLNEICSDCFDERYGEINNIFAYDFPLTE